MSRSGVIGPPAPDFLGENAADALQRLGDIRKEALAFPSFGALVEQAVRLLSGRPLTVSLDEAAMQRTHRAHTYGLRVIAILEKLS